MYCRRAPASRSEERRVGKVTGVQTCALPISPERLQSQAPAPLHSASAADACHPPTPPPGGSADRIRPCRFGGCAAPVTGPLRPVLPACKRVECTAAGLLRQDRKSVV